jgi:membrane-associated protein
MLDIINSQNLALFIAKFGYIGVFTIVFAESAIFIGFFLPGDSLLVLAGLLAARGLFNPYILISGICIFTFIGYIISYYLGYYLGEKMLQWPDKYFFKQEYLLKSRKFFHSRGFVSIIIARFIPIVRSFIPIVAGISAMPMRRYMLCNALGSIIWGAGLCGFGMFIFRLIPDPERHITGIIMLIICISLIPIGISIMKKFYSKESV